MLTSLHTGQRQLEAGGEEYSGATRWGRTAPGDVV